VDTAVVEMRRIANASGAGADRNGRRGKPTITPYTQRATEVHLLYERGLAPREALGQGTGPLAARAAHLGRALADRFRLNDNLIEVSPKATLTALGFTRPYKKHLREQETRARILETLSPELGFGPGVWRELCVQSDHLFDAVICAFTGFLWARDGWTETDTAARALSQGRHDGRHDDREVRIDGWIWVPPTVVSQTQTPPADVLTAQRVAGKN
jgi:hypothetical protein